MEKYFNGPSGVYYDPAEKFQDLIILTEVEPYQLVCTKTMKITDTIKRYDIETADYKKRKTALTPYKELVYLGEL